MWLRHWHSLSGSHAWCKYQIFPLLLPVVQNWSFEFFCLKFHPERIYCCSNILVSWTMHVSFTHLMQWLPLSFVLPSVYLVGRHIFFSGFIGLFVLVTSLEFESFVMAWICLSTTAIGVAWPLWRAGKGQRRHSHWRSSYEWGCRPCYGHCMCSFLFLLPCSLMKREYAEVFVEIGKHGWQWDMLDRCM